MSGREVWAVWNAHDAAVLPLFCPDEAEAVKIAVAWGEPWVCSLVWVPAFAKIEFDFRFWRSPIEAG